MAAVKSNLTEEAEQKLMQLLGYTKLSLLFKGSVHGFTVNAFHNKCDLQGPTLTVAYNKPGYIFGGYTSQSFNSGAGNYLHDENAFLFSIGLGQVDSKIIKIPTENAANAVYTANNSGINFGNGALHLIGAGTAVQSASNNVYKFEPIALHGNDLVLVECEVYRVESLGELLPTPWRKLSWTVEQRREYMDMVKNYTPFNLIPRIRVLLIGPVGVGKSSFFNSVNSVFRGHVTSQAIAGSASSSLTTKFRAYSIRDGREGKPLPVMLCDTMGLEEHTGTGIDTEDIVYILKGHVPENYQFNPSVSFNSDTLGYIKNPSLKDQIHCVAFVMDACKISILSPKLEEKLCAIRSKINMLGVPQIVLLTKVDEACPLVAENTENIYRSRYIESKIHAVGARLGIPVSCVMPVKNYSSEVDLEKSIDILLLAAIIQMQRFADNYLDNFCIYDEKFD